MQAVLLAQIDESLAPFWHWKIILLFRLGPLEELKLLMKTHPACIKIINNWIVSWD